MPDTTPEEILDQMLELRYGQKNEGKQFLEIAAMAGLEIGPGWSSDMKAAPRDEAAGKIRLCDNLNGIVAFCWWINKLGWCSSEDWNSVTDSWESVPIDFEPTNWKPLGPLPVPPEKEQTP